MGNKLQSTAYHEAGHSIAYLLTNMKFQYVTIKPEGTTLGYVKRKAGSSFKWEFNAITDPVKFSKYLVHDFIKIAGIVSEKIYSGRFNHSGAQSDYRNCVDTSLIDLPEKLNLKYQRFLIEYTKEILEKEVNWIRITAVAEALLERHTLNYDQVWEVIRERIYKELNDKSSS